MDTFLHVRTIGRIPRLLLGIHLATGPVIGLFGTGAILAALATGKSLPLPLFIALVAPGLALGILPSTSAMLACGALHGWIGATALYPALILASLPGFAAIRHAFRPEARALLGRHPAARSVVERLERKTFSVATLLRVAPVSTFAWTNALLAASRIPARSYVAATALGLLPRLLLLTWAGTSGRSLAAALRTDGGGAAAIAGLAISAASLLALGWIALRVLRTGEGRSSSVP